MNEDLESKVKEAEEVVNTKLNNLYNKYDIDPIEVYTNYLKNWRAFVLKPTDDDTPFTIIYKALDETIAQYESIYGGKDGV